MVILFIFSENYMFAYFYSYLCHLNHPFNCLYFDFAPFFCLKIPWIFPVFYWVHWTKFLLQQPWRKIETWLEVFDLGKPIIAVFDFFHQLFIAVSFFFSLTEAVSLILHWEWKTILGSSVLNSILSYFLVFHFSPNSSYVAILFLDPSTSLPLILE